MNPVRVLLLDLIRGLDPSTAEIADHLNRLDRIKVRVGAESLPENWRSWPSELKGMLRDGIVTQDDGGNLHYVPAVRLEQKSMF